MRRSRAGRLGRRKASSAPAATQPRRFARAKSFADDLVAERGIVNGRVAHRYDPLRLSLRSSDLSHWGLRGEILPWVMLHT